MKFDLRQYLSENKLMKEQQDRRIQDAVNFLIDDYNIASKDEALNILYDAGIIGSDKETWTFEPNEQFEKDMGRPHTYKDVLEQYMDDYESEFTLIPNVEPEDQAVELPADQSVDTLNYEETEVDKELLQQIESDLNVAQKDTTDYRERYRDAVVKVENDTIQTIESQIQQELVQVPDVEELKQTVLSQLINEFEETYGIKMMEGDTTFLAKKADEIARDSVMRVIEQNKEILGTDDSGEQDQQAIDSIEDTVKTTKSDRERLEEELRNDFGDDAVDSAAAGGDDDGDGGSGDGVPLSFMIGGFLTLLVWAIGASVFIAILIMAIIALFSLFRSDNNKNLQESQLETLVEYELRKNRMLNEEEKEQIVNTTRSKTDVILDSIKNMSPSTGTRALGILYRSSTKLTNLYLSSEKTNQTEVISFVNELSANLQQLGEKQQKNKEELDKIISELTSLIKR